MSHAFVTVIASVPIKDVAALRASIAALGNPANPKLAAALDGLATVHFASLNVFEASAGDRGYLVFEFSGDGASDVLLRQLDERLCADLDPIFSHAGDRGTGSLHEFWTAHIVEVGQSPFANPGVNFTGTPGLSVERIRRERELALHLTDLVHKTAPGMSAFRRLTEIRKKLRLKDEWRWAFDPEPIAQGGTGGDLPETFLQSLPIIATLAGPFARTFLWPLAIPAVVAFLTALWIAGFTAHGALLALGWAALTALATAGIAAVAAYLLYREFRRREDAEVPIDVAPERGAVAAIMQRENYAAQNHLAALSVVKPGGLRRFTLVLAFWSIAQLAARYYRPGFLGSLGTIHFARWVQVPRTGDLLFLSNYGGSWESYLEDFITKAHVGLTGVWSNTAGFPKASNLFQDGATDGERFKRWARRQQIPTAFWYSAYPDLTTRNIRTNAVIRQGLAAVMTEDEAESWLALFGSEARPASALESNEIQSLILGGMGFLSEGAALIFGLAEDVAASKAWLGEVLPTISFSDGRAWNDATILGLAASALRKLDLPAASMATFPPAFMDGMAAPWRARVLGDVEENAPGKWQWGGKPEEGIDGVLLLYARSGAELDRLRGRAVALLRKHGHAERRTIPFRSLHAADDRPDQPIRAKHEPFGFADGISQPVIRGTYKALRGADPIHLVEAGEFILGYRDNRGHIPPTPTLAAIHDPASLLPVTAATSPDFGSNTVNADRDLGRNGSFLAIRQLEQNVEAFWAYCEAEGKRLKPHFPPGVRAQPNEFIAAKIVGRWRDGSPLVRYPRYPATEAPVEAHPLSRTGTAQAQAAAQIPAAPAPALRVLKQARAAAETALKIELAERAPERRHDQRASGEKPGPAFEPDNDFLFGVEDPQGLRCPFGAHIRRANPRESFDPGSHEQLDITNRHRIIRIGRLYEPQPGRMSGLLFMCLNGDLERQFEFVQQTWAQGSSFHGLSHERDPLIGERRGEDGYTMPTRDGPMRLMNLPSFVRTLGGGYFFLPGRRTLEYLASQPAAY